MNKKEIIATLVKNGAKVTKNVTVKNVTITQFETHCRVTLTTDAAIPAFILDEETGEYKESTTNLIYTSTYAIASLLKDIPEASFAAANAVENPKSLNVILSGATISVITELAKAGVDYINPWSTNEANVAMFDHDVYITHVTDIEFSKFAKEKLDQLAMHMMMGN